MKSKTSRIVFILPCFNGGGAERVAINYANYLAQYFQVTLLVFNDTGPLIKEVAPSVCMVTLNKSRLMFSLFSLIKQLRQLKPDYIYSTFGYINLVLLMAKPFLGRVKLICREANTVSATCRAFRYPAVVRMLYKIYYPKASLILCNSVETYSELSELVNKSNLKLLANPVDVDTVLLKSKETVKEFPEERVNFLAVGRLCEQKGFQDLLEWFVPLDASCSLTIIGDGPLRCTLEKEVMRNGLENVSLIGYQSNPWRYMSQADYLIISSYWEGCPNAALEALAIGCPIVSVEQLGQLRQLSKETEGVKVYPRAEMAAVLPTLKRKDKQTNLLPKQYSLQESAKLLHNTLMELSES